MNVVNETERDWEAECRGLGYMILTIANHYDALHGSPRKLTKMGKLLGGDSELLFHAVTQARQYVDGPLREALGVSDVPARPT